MLYGGTFPPVYGNYFHIVLILIFLENALRQELCEQIYRKQKVLILIFLENALRLYGNYFHIPVPSYSLNPYFFGKCSTAHMRKLTRTITAMVLILIFLENALRQTTSKLTVLDEGVLILIFLENALRLSIFDGLKNNNKS